jgi:hypothetical protein
MGINSQVIVALNNCAINLAKNVVTSLKNCQKRIQIPCKRCSKNETKIMIADDLKITINFNGLDQMEPAHSKRALSL